MNVIYFDNAASEKQSAASLKTYLEASERFFANANSRHALGREANRALEDARLGILKDLGLEKTHNLIFVSGATEANNLALKGIAHLYKSRGNRIITSKGEHPSVRNPILQLENEGFEGVFLPFDPINGSIRLADLADVLNSKTILCSFIATNNETGAVLDLAGVSALVKRFPKCFLHIDATQAIGKVDLPWAKADLISFSAHKFAGPKGIGALVYRKSIRFEAVEAGGDQESGFRGGTSALPSILAMREALHETLAARKEKEPLVAKIQSYLKEALRKVDGIIINSPEDGSPYILNLSLERKKAAVLVEALSHRGIYIGSVSACSSKGEPVSEPLLAMGKPKGLAMNSIRISLSPDNTMEEAEAFLPIFLEEYERLIDR